MYSIFCAFGVLFVIFIVPETKGHHLDDIHKLFVRKDALESNYDETIEENIHLK